MHDAPFVPASFELAFVCLTFSLGAWWLFVAAKASAGSVRAVLVCGIAIAGWMLLTASAAHRGMLLAEVWPPAFLRLVLPAVLLTVAIAFSPMGTRVIERVPLAWLIGFQAFRVPVELLLHAFWRHDALPLQMTYLGRNFDILSGLSAPVVALLLSRGTVGRRTVAVWNVVALVLLVNIVATAIASLPQFHVFVGPPNRLVLYAPYVWLPAVLVQSA